MLCSAPDRLGSSISIPSTENNVSFLTHTFFLLEGPLVM